MSVDTSVLTELVEKVEKVLDDDPDTPPPPPPPPDSPQSVCSLLDVLDGLVDTQLGDAAIAHQVDQMKRLVFLNPIKLVCEVTTDDLDKDEGVLSVNIAPQVAADLMNVIQTTEALAPGIVTGLLGVDVALPNSPLTQNYQLNNNQSIDLAHLPLPFVGHALATIVEDDDFPSDDDTLGPYVIKAAPGYGTVAMAGATGKYVLHYEVIPFVGNGGMLRKAAGCPSDKPGQQVQGITVAPVARYAAVWRADGWSPMLLQGGDRPEQQRVRVAKPDSGVAVLGRKMAPATKGVRRRVDGRKTLPPLKHKNLVLTDLSRDDAIQEWQRLTGEGMRLTALEPFGSRDTWTLVFEPGDDAHGLLFGTRDAIVKQNNDFFAHGLRMVDLVSYVDKGQAVWAAAWRAGQGRQDLVMDLSWDDFIERWKKLSADGLRLSGITGRPAHGGRLWSGFFHAGSDGHAFWAGNWDGFVATWKDLADKGLRLVDLASFYEGDQQRWAGVWRAGTDGHMLLAGLDEDGFLKHHLSAVMDGLRLVSVAVTE